MSQTTDGLKKDFQHTLGLLRTLRDEMRVKAHLAGMDVRDEWQKLEPRVMELEAEAERTASEVAEKTKTAVSEVVDRLTKLRASIK